MRRPAAALTAALTSIVGIGTATAPAADAWRPPPAKPCGATAADRAMAIRLSPKIHSAGLSGVNADQVSCARQIVAEVRGEGFTDRAGVVALMTAITESGLHNYLGGDRDSLGLFQQRPSMGWGSKTQIIRPAYSTSAFLRAMVTRFPNGSWKNTDPGRVAQAVQRSAYPSRYNRERAVSTALVNALWKAAPAPTPTKPPATGARVKGLRLSVPTGGIRVRSGASTAARRIAFLRAGTAVVASCQRVGRAVRVGNFRSPYWVYLPAQKGYVSLAGMHRNGSTALKAC